MKIKRHLLCWHLLQSHTPPPLPHPSCHNCKNSTNTHAHSCIFTLTHTHHFSCSHLFPLATTLSSWCSCAHSWLHVNCVCVHMWTCRLFVAAAPAEYRHGFTHLCFCKATGKRDELYFISLLISTSFIYDSRKGDEVTSRSFIPTFFEFPLFMCFWLNYSLSPKCPIRYILELNQMFGHFSSHHSCVKLLCMSGCVRGSQWNTKCFLFWQQHHMQGHKSDHQRNRIQRHCCLQEATGISKDLWSGCR